ncbi:MAG: hypothetical protein L0Y56_09715, partial [Nitrospira sp.]|nr:hypothetical protein [Nitrospira sp.]
GGPGAGPVGIKSRLVPFMPIPTPERKEWNKESVGVWEYESMGVGSPTLPHSHTPTHYYYLDYNRPQSIGKVRAFYGNFGMLVRAYSYIWSLGAEGLRRVSETAVINANYIMSQLRDVYHLPYDRHCKHECVFSDKFQLKNEVKTLDIAKRLMDYGFHPPTIYFPLVVQGALMIEPTETESKETLDEFIWAMRAIACEAAEEPETVRSAPHISKVRRLDETAAARKPKLRWEKDSSPPKHKEVSKVPKV